jgi:hypothetical protein
MTSPRELPKQTGRFVPAQNTPEVCLAPRRLPAWRPARLAHQTDLPAPGGHHAHQRTIQAFPVAPRGPTSTTAKVRTTQSGFSRG